MASKVVRESKLDKKQVSLAVPALMKYVEQKKGKALRLLNDADAVWLVLALKKIPQADKKPKKIPIPHSVYPEDKEVCLITKENGSKVKEILKLKGVSSINKVISLEKLKKNYKSFQSKRELAAQYDVFLCDDRIYHLLPRLLGKAFFSKKKFPIPFDIKKTNLNGEINKNLQCTFVSLGHGSCSAIRVAHTRQGEDKTISNIISTVAGLAKLVPRGWNNIQSLHIKTCDSISLPIYNSLPANPTSISVEPPRKKKKSDDDQS